MYAYLAWYWGTSNIRLYIYGYDLSWYWGTLEARFGSRSFMVLLNPKCRSDQDRIPASPCHHRLGSPPWASGSASCWWASTCMSCVRSPATTSSSSTASSERSRLHPGWLRVPWGSRTCRYRAYAGGWGLATCALGTQGKQVRGLHWGGWAGYMCPGAPGHATCRYGAYAGGGGGLATCGGLEGGRVVQWCARVLGTRGWKQDPIFESGDAGQVFHVMMCESNPRSSQDPVPEQVKIQYQIHVLGIMNYADRSPTCMCVDMCRPVTWAGGA